MSWPSGDGSSGGQMPMFGSSGYTPTAGTAQAGMNMAGGVPMNEMNGMNGMAGMSQMNAMNAMNPMMFMNPMMYMMGGPMNNPMGMPMNMNMPMNNPMGGMPYMPGPGRPYGRQASNMIQRNTGRPYSTGATGGDVSLRGPGGAGRGVNPRSAGTAGRPGKYAGTSSVQVWGVHNDYSENFVCTGARPQNFIRTSEEKNPNRMTLIRKKENAVDKHSLPSMCLNVDLHTFSLKKLGSKFDVLLIDPPWDTWSLEELQSLEIEAICESPAWLFLWCGSEIETLEKGRALMEKWNFRRSEVISWIKTNKDQCSVQQKMKKKKKKKEKVRDSDDDEEEEKEENDDDDDDEEDDEMAAGEECKLVKETRDHAVRAQPSSSLFVHTVEHCLLGLRGTAYRKDAIYFHANIDVDLIISEEDPADAERKPDELYRIIEHFCLQSRRLELFGRDHNCRRGWVTLGNQLSRNTWNAEEYTAFYRENGTTLPDDPDIERLRPRSPGQRYQPMEFH